MDLIPLALLPVREPFSAGGPQWRAIYKKGCGGAQVRVDLRGRVVKEI